MRPTIRPATEADLDAIVEVFLGCWHESYAGVLPDRLVERMDQPQAEALWTRVVFEARGDGLLLAVDPTDGSVLAVTRFVTDGPEAMVHSLYVSPRAQGRGVGALLLSTACDQLAAMGSELVRLWVFAENTPSRGFYERQGFLPDGTTRVQDQFGEPEVRLVRKLASDARLTSEGRFTSDGATGMEDQ